MWTKKMLCAAALLGAAALPAGAADYSVAAMQALTGPAAFVGAPYRDGMLLALDDINKAQFLGAGNTLKISAFEDDASNLTQTLTLLRKFSADPKVLAVMGPTSVSVSVPASNMANDEKIPLFTGASSMDTLKAGPWSFLLTQPGFVAVPTIGKYAVEKLKVKACASMGINDVEIYATLTKLFMEYVGNHGVKIVAQENFKSSDADFSALATKVASMNVDCVFVSAPAQQSANLIRQLRTAGLDSKVRIIGHNGLSSVELIKAGGSAVEGVFFYADFVPGDSEPRVKRFETDFTARYGHGPDNFAAIGYSSMWVMATALKNAGTNPTRDAVRAGLTAIRNVPVVIGEGSYSYDKDRVPHYGAIILTVKDGKFVRAE